ncbi:hypothetical protein PAMP_009188 [Pampus punctatissimus]
MFFSNFILAQACQGQFRCGVLPGLYCYFACMMLIAVSNRGEVGEQERIITTQGTFPQETYTHNPPFFSSSISPLSICFVGGLTFPSPSLRNDQLLLFYICVIIFFFLFRRDIFSDVEVASCVLRRLLRA